MREYLKLFWNVQKVYFDNIVFNIIWLLSRNQNSQNKFIDYPYELLHKSKNIELGLDSE